jgi:glycosyltransferase involved in cell wall biosynthesis
MKIRLVVFCWRGLEPLTAQSAWGELETLRKTDGISGIDITFRSGRGLSGNPRSEEMDRAKRDGVDCLVEVDGDLVWTYGEIAKKALRCMELGASLGVWGKIGAVNWPYLRILPTAESETILEPELTVQQIAGDGFNTICHVDERIEFKWAGDKPTVLLGIDRPGWAFDNIAQKVAARFSDSHEIQIKPYWQVKGECDLMVMFWWASMINTLEHVHPKKLALCIYDEFSYEKPADAARLVEYAKRADVMVAANERIAARLSAMEIAAPVVVCEDGVDTDLFTPRPFPEEFTVGWCGNSNAGRHHGIEDLKGLGIIEKACEQAGVRLEKLDSAAGSQLPHDAMPDWYQSISVYCCASLVEGTPNPVLEAMACGRPVISTDVGLVPKMGCQMVDRSVNEFAHYIGLFKEFALVTMRELGKGHRTNAEAQSWAITIESWADVLKVAECSG